MAKIELCLACVGKTGECGFHPEECPQFQPLAWLVSEIDDMLLPYCVCGRRWSQCDGSRAKCHTKKDRA
jgi:hypothetical protein